MSKESEIAPIEGESFKWEVKEAGEFPFVGALDKVSWGGWVLILLGVALGLFIDLNGSNIIEAIVPHGDLALGRILSLVVMILVPGAPLLMVWIAAKDNIKELFRHHRRHNWMLVVALIVLGYLYSMVVGYILHKIGQPVSADAVTNGMMTGSKGWEDTVAVLIQLPFLLFGETLFVTLPFLFLFSVGRRALKMPRKATIVVSAILACLLFGLYHFYAYDWHLAQMFLVIGLGQLFMLFGYIKTKNMWVSFAVHLIYDSIIFVSILLVDLAKLFS